MTDSTRELDEILDFIENYGVSASCDGFDPHKSRNEAKQAILDWHNKRELEARIDKEAWLRIFEATRAAVHATNIAIINTNDAFDAMKNKLEAEL